MVLRSVEACLPALRMKLNSHSTLWEQGNHDCDDPDIGIASGCRRRVRLRHIEHHAGGNDGHKQLAKLHDEIELLVIGAERQRTNDLFCAGKLTDEARRRIERELDLREAHLANQVDGVSGLFVRHKASDRASPNVAEGACNAIISEIYIPTLNA